MTNKLAETDYESEFLEHLQHISDVLEWEICRNTPATQDWFTLISNTAILARMCLDEILEVNPGLLQANRPSDESQTAPEKSARLLGHAIERFDSARAEMSRYLVAPGYPAAIEDFIESVEQSLRSMQS
jgi:hypothetical protein